MIFTVGHSTKAAIVPDGTSAAGKKNCVGSHLGALARHQFQQITFSNEWYANGLAWHMNEGVKYEF